jgi:magnesium and cobalt transporter
MNDPKSTKEQGKRSWLDEISNFLCDKPSSREELLQQIRQAETDQVLDLETLGVIEGAMQISEMQVRNIMIPRPQMATVRINQPPQEFITTIIDSAHSRFPVVGETLDDIHGILLAKDLLPYTLQGNIDDFDINKILRKPIFVPESKRLTVLLNEFRTNRYHMALVLDEYDAEDNSGNIRPLAESGHMVKGLTSVEDFNLHFNTCFDADEFGTIGGIVTHQFGHLPNKGETTVIDALRFHILAADSRRIRLLKVEPVLSEDGSVVRHESFNDSSF